MSSNVRPFPSRPGRPRGKNYVINCRQHGRTPRDGSSSPAAVPDDSRFEFARLTKSFFGTVLRNERQIAGRQPVFDARELDLVNDGIRLRSPHRPGFEMLRAASYRTSIVGAIHQARVLEWGPYSSAGGADQGFGVMLEDEERKPTAAERRLFKDARKFLEYMGDRINPGWSGRPNFRSVFQMMLRDSLAIDSNAFWIIRNRRGDLAEIRYLDPATIFEIDPRRGYRGDRSIAHVQIVNNEVVMTFGPGEVAVYHENELSDVYMRGTGFSPTEACVMELVGVLQALRYNRQKFTDTPPLRGFISVTGNASQEQLDDIAERFHAYWADNQNTESLPVFASDGEIKFNPLDSKDDMAFANLLQWLMLLVFAAHSMEPGELGFRLYASSALSEPSPDGRISRASQRAKSAKLRYFADIVNSWREMTPAFESVRYYFMGVEPRDRDKEIDRAAREAASTRLVDETRVAQDLPTLGEAMRELYDMTEEEAEKVRFAGAYIGAQPFLAHAGGMVGSLTGSEQSLPGQSVDSV